MKVKRKKIIIFIAILVLIIIGFSGYIVYDKILTNQEKETNKTIDNNTKVKEKTKEENIVNEEIKKDYNQSKNLTKEEERYVILEEQKNKYMILMKGNKQHLIVNENETWIELDSVKTESLAYQVIAVENDVIYYITHKGQIISESLIDDHSGGMIYGDVSNTENYYSSYLTKDNLYIQFYDGEYYGTYSVLEFELDKNGMIKEVNDDILTNNEPIDFQIMDNKIYFIEAYNGCDSDLKSYDITTKEMKVIKEKVCEFNLINDNIIIAKNTTNEAYFKYYLLNPKTLKMEHIINAENLVKTKNKIYLESNNIIYEYQSGNLEPLKQIAKANIGDYDNNNIYYLENNIIYSYNGFNATKLYKGDSSTKIAAYNILAENKIQIFTEKEYYNILDGEKVDKSKFKSSFPSYKVTIIGTGGTVTTKTFKVISGEYYEPYENN